MHQLPQVMNATPNDKKSARLTVAQPETNAVIPTSNRKQPNGAVPNNTTKKHEKRGRPKKQSSENRVFFSVTSEQSTTTSTIVKRKNRMQPAQTIISPSVFTGTILRETLAKFGVSQAHATTQNIMDGSTEEISDSQFDTLLTPNMIFKQDAAVQTEGMGEAVLTMNVYTQTNIPDRISQSAPKPPGAVRHIATNTNMIATDLVPMNKHYLFDRNFTQQMAYRTGVDEALLRHTIFDLLTEDNNQEAPMPSHHQQGRPAPPRLHVNQLIAPPFYVNHDIVPSQNHNSYGWLNGDVAGNHVNDFHDYGNVNEVDHLTQLTMRLNTISPTQVFGRDVFHDESGRYGYNLSPIRQYGPPIHGMDLVNNYDIGMFDAPAHGSQDVLNQGFYENGSISNVWNTSNESTGPKVIDATIADQSNWANNEHGVDFPQEQ